MKKKLPLLILIALALVAAAYYFLSKKNSVPAFSPEKSGSSEDTDDHVVYTGSAPDRIALIKEMKGYISRLYTGDLSKHKALAEDWANGMYSWCRDELNGWSFADQQSSADKNGYPLALQMVQSIAWQLYATSEAYDKAVWKKLEERIFNIAVDEQ